MTFFLLVESLTGSPSTLGGKRAVLGGNKLNGLTLGRNYPFFVKGEKMQSPRSLCASPPERKRELFFSRTKRRAAGKMQTLEGKGPLNLLLQERNGPLLLGGTWKGGAGRSSLIGGEETYSSDGLRLSARKGFRKGDPLLPEEERRGKGTV